MNKLQLQEILSAPFELENWRGALTEAFGAKQFHQQPQPILLPSNNKADSAFELGSFHTADDRLIGLYQVNVLPNVWLERNCNTPQKLDHRLSLLKLHKTNRGNHEKKSKKVFSGNFHRGNKPLYNSSIKKNSLMFYLDVVHVFVNLQV